MCGILGGTNKNWNYKEGIWSLHHRGPDAQQVKEFDDCTLAFARLAIIDLSEKGMQPMTSLDGTVSIVYNGEIYGYDFLKKELEKKYLFQSNTDTEVILNAYLEYGEDFINKIDGMFSFAIYDKRKHQIILYRDRPGIKPLYYYHANGQFAFASELKALVTGCTDVKWDMDYTALYDYLFYQYIPEPKTMYKNCYKLPPAHRLVFDLKEKRIVSIKKYWKMHVNTSKGIYRKEDVLWDELRTILEKEVKKQLQADVAVGCFLSGGIDSSIVAYESNKISPYIHTYTIGFKERKYDESPYADRMIQRYSFNSTKKMIGYDDIDNIRGRLKSWYDEPFADTSAYPSYIVSELARKDVTVVLTGDGGDELFGGYSRYQRYGESFDKKRIDQAWISWLGKKLKLENILSDQNMKKFVYTGLENYIPCITLTDKKTVENYRREWGISKDYNPYWHLEKYYKKELPTITRARYLDFKTYLPGDILTKIDRVSMANSLEARVPFLGKSVIEFAFSLSEEECCTFQVLKRILKQAYKDRIPEKILNGRKKGFSIPPYYFSSTRKGIPITCELLDKEFLGDLMNIN